LNRLSKKMTLKAALTPAQGGIKFADTGAHTNQENAVG